jgi:hypothetical protein
MRWNDHDHRGEYAEERHDRGLDYAEKHHRHYDLETDDKTAQQRITCLRDEVAGLREQLGHALGRVTALETANLRLAAALRASLAEHDAGRRTAMADQAHLAVSTELADAFTALVDVLEGAHNTEPEPMPEQHDPAPEVDDEGGMSEYRYTLPEDFQRGQS